MLMQKKSITNNGDVFGVVGVGRIYIAKTSRNLFVFFFLNEKNTKDASLLVCSSITLSVMG